MGIYLSALLLSVCFSFLYNRGNGKDIRIHKGKLILNGSLLFGVLSFLPLTLVAGLRYDVGTDWSGTYLQIFNSIKNGSKIRDGGYGVLNQFALLFTDSYAGIIFLSAALIGVFVYMAIFQQSKIPAMSILLFVFTGQYFFSLNGIRQALATSIFIYAIKYIRQRDYKKYFFWILIAVSVHTMALLYIPLYFYKPVAKFYKQILFILFFGFIYSEQVSGLVQILLRKLRFLNRYFSWYFQSQYNSGRLSIISLAVQICVLLLMIYIYRSYCREDEESQLFLVMQILAVASLILSAAVPLMQRVSFLFSFGNIIYLPNYIKKIKNKKIVFGISTLILVCFFVYMWGTIVIRNYNEVLPYQSIFL